MERPIKAVWSDEYNGPRYTYYSPLRPFPVFLLPTGWVAVITGPGSDLRTIVTTKPLPQQFIDQTSLERVQPDRDLDTIDLEHDLGLRDLTDPFER